MKIRSNKLVMFVQEASTVLKEVSYPWDVQLELIRIRKIKDLARPAFISSMTAFAAKQDMQKLSAKLKVPAQEFLRIPIYFYFPCQRCW